MLKQVSSYLKSHENSVKKVQYILIGLFTFLILFDVYLAWKNIMTISRYIQLETLNGLFVLTYFWGVLASNLFITRKSKKIVNEVIGTAIILGIAVLIVVFDIGKITIDYCTQHYSLNLAHGISMLFGFLMAFIFWRQDHTFK